MANTKYSGVTPVDIEADMRWGVSRDPDGTPSDSAVTMARIGALEVDTTYDTAADHSDITAAVGKLYTIDLSAVTTNNLNITLPDTANVGEKVAVHITATNDTYELEVLTAASGSLLNGTDTSGGTGVWKVWIKDEVLEMTCVKAGGAGDTDWVVSHDGRIMCITTMGTTNSTDLMTVNNTDYQIPLNAPTLDYGGCGRAEEDDVLIRRTGRYMAIGAWYTGNDSPSGDAILSASIEKNNGATTLAQWGQRQSSTYNHTSVAIAAYLTSGDTLELWGRCNNISTALNTASGGDFTVWEVKTTA